MTDAERITLLEKQLADLRLDVDEFRGRCTPLKALPLLPGTILHLEMNGITSAERLLATVGGDWNRLLNVGPFRLTPHEVSLVRKAVREWLARANP